MCVSRLPTERSSASLPSAVRARLCSSDSFPAEATNSCSCTFTVDSRPAIAAFAPRSSLSACAANCRLPNPRPHDDERPCALPRLPTTGSAGRLKGGRPEILALPLPTAPQACWRASLRLRRLWPWLACSPGFASRRTLHHVPASSTACHRRIWNMTPPASHFQVQLACLPYCSPPDSGVEKQQIHCCSKCVQY